MGAEEIKNEQQQTEEVLDALWQGQTPDVPDLEQLDLEACQLEEAAKSARICCMWADRMTIEERKEVEKLEAEAKEARAKHTAAIQSLRPNNAK